MQEAGQDYEPTHEGHGLVILQQVKIKFRLEMLQKHKDDYHQTHLK